MRAIRGAKHRGGTERDRELQGMPPAPHELLQELVGRACGSTCLSCGAASPVDSRAK